MSIITISLSNYQITDFIIRLQRYEWRVRGGWVGGGIITFGRTYIMSIITISSSNYQLTHFIIRLQRYAHGGYGGVFLFCRVKHGGQ